LPHPSFAATRSIGCLLDNNCATFIEAKAKAQLLAGWLAKVLLLDLGSIEQLRTQIY
jgi:hypothetical protein